MSDLKTQLTLHEGLRYELYECPSGKLTIGVGRNIEDRGISPDEADLMLENDINIAQNELRQRVGVFDQLTDTRKRVLIDMVFNMGITRFMTFQKMLGALAKSDYQKAAAEMLDSKWARQVHSRADSLAEMMKRG
ncbi:glycoside hydrolase family protein [Pseudoalteromonas sp. DL2-H2.2]|uniref:glycoside hydrolase family protein n=1 Tax=Pseudoalteromonas sp. DL2-H2.2 TaxID=2908889 RepID=UPI001F1E18BB|nr:glycoside hydrolase family protein [Pseudoalteromonas sp. DL2-H2.2]MCF2910000.1 glycoside hydrolase family protein [Pseudoalteromonas sp. DL2-H2.2]